MTGAIFGEGWAVAGESAKPAWVQIEEQLTERIEAGRLAPGERIPPERELAEHLSVSRMTVRQALASLAARGLVERGVGRGTFVRESGTVTHDLTRFTGFTGQVERSGLAGGGAGDRGHALPGARDGRRGAGAGGRRRPCCGSSGSAPAAAGR